jgi:SOS-response transcriptional repressor LexA
MERKRNSYDSELIFRFIQKWISDNQRPPTLQEIQTHLVFPGGYRLTSKSVLRYHLTKLEEQGKIIRDRGISRGIRIARP